MAIIAVVGRKGGVGKSTIVGNLAAEFAAMGRSVSVLDADPQHSLTAWAAQGDGMLATGCWRARSGKCPTAPTFCGRERTRPSKMPISC